MASLPRRKNFSSPSRVCQALPWLFIHRRTWRHGLCAERYRSLATSPLTWTRFPGSPIGFTVWAVETCAHVRVHTCNRVCTPDRAGKRRLDDRKPTGFPPNNLNSLIPTPPSVTQVKKWNGTDYDVFIFSSGSWSFGSATFLPGEGAFLIIFNYLRLSDLGQLERGRLDDNLSF